MNVFKRALVAAAVLAAFTATTGSAVANGVPGASGGPKTVVILAAYTNPCYHKPVLPDWCEP